MTTKVANVVPGARYADPPSGVPAGTPKVEPAPALIRVAGFASAFRLARKGIARVDDLYGATAERLAELAGLDGPRAEALLLAVEAHRTGGGADAEEPAPVGLVSGDTGFRLAPPQVAQVPRDLDPKEIERRLRLMEPRRPDRSRGPLRSARLCGACGVIISSPKRNHARQKGEPPSHGAGYSYAVHLCEQKGTVSAADAGRKVRDMAARHPENDVVFRDWDGVE